VVAAEVMMTEEVMTGGGEEDPDLAVLEENDHTADLVAGRGRMSAEEVAPLAGIATLGPRVGASPGRQ
jgi:hypothetical protein